MSILLLLSLCSVGLYSAPGHIILFLVTCGICSWIISLSRGFIGLLVLIIYAGGRLIIFCYVMMFSPFFIENWLSFLSLRILPIGGLLLRGSCSFYYFYIISSITFLVAFLLFLVIVCVVNLVNFGAAPLRVL